MPPGSNACHTQPDAHRYHHTPCEVVHPGHSHMPHPAARSTAVATLEKRVEDRSEALITEIRNNIVEKKDKINETRNTRDAMDTRMEEAEKRISDQEDREMEGNQAENEKE